MRKKEDRTEQARSGGPEDGKRAYPGRRPPAPRPGGQKQVRRHSGERETEAPEGVESPAPQGGRLRRRDGMAALSALAREARRRRVSYGTLCQMLTGEEREAIVRIWQAEHPAAVRDDRRCAGCVYWREGSATAPEMGYLCHFALDHGHSRRRDGETCLEYRQEEGVQSSGAAMWRAWAAGRSGDAR